ncbi:tyrosine-type recombinase/integrase [Cupriavidus necator]|uniref:tyrosine-type recombinase/integrase n=1 Tax=Cupriavidus necator TaxID=106590 RepID=UPI0039C200AD
MYRGLMPQTCLILTHKGGPYELSVKRRTNEAGELVDYLAADSLQSYVTGLYRAAGLGRGYSSHSGRRTFASRLLAQGHLLDTVQLLLGHSHFDHISPYLEVSKRDFREACAALDSLF